MPESMWHFWYHDLDKVKKEMRPVSRLVAPRPLKMCLRASHPTIKWSSMWSPVSIGVNVRIDNVHRGRCNNIMNELTSASVNHYNRLFVPRQHIRGHLVQFRGQIARCFLRRSKCKAFRWVHLHCIYSANNLCKDVYESPTDLFKALLFLAACA